MFHRGSEIFLLNFSVVLKIARSGTTVASHTYYQLAVDFNTLCSAFRVVLPKCMKPHNQVMIHIFRKHLGSSQMFFTNQERQISESFYLYFVINRMTP